MAPLLLGFVLGKLMEENLRRALLVNDGSFAFMWERPITAGLLLVSTACLLVPVVSKFRAARQAAKVSADSSKGA